MATPKTIGLATSFCSALRRISSELVATRLFTPSDVVFHHDDGSADNHSEIDGAETHQIRADSEKPHAEEADQHREWNHRRDDHGSGNIA
jgi:hypothetical protein